MTQLEESKVITNEEPGEIIRKMAESESRSRERSLSLLNDMTQAILLSSDFDSTLRLLSVHMTQLAGAQDCIITRWDEASQTVTPLVGSLPNFQANDHIQTLTACALNTGRVLAIQNKQDTPYPTAEIDDQKLAVSALAVPLMAGTHRLGAAIVTFNTQHRFTSYELELAERAGSQITLALWNFQQSAEIQRRLKESTALSKIERMLSETERTGTDKVLQLIVDSALELIQPAEESVIHLLDSDEETLLPKAVAGHLNKKHFLPPANLRLDKGVAGQVIREGITINIANIETDPRFVQSGALPNFRSLLVAPVQSGKKQTGTISVQSPISNAFNIHDLELLKSLGVQAAIAIENTRLLENIQQRLKEVDALYKTTRQMAASLDPDELIKKVVSLLDENFKYYSIQIYVLDIETDQLILKGANGNHGEQLLKQNHSLLRGASIAGHVLETGAPFLTNNVNDAIFFEPNPILPDTQSLLAVPIKIGDDTVGVFDIQDKPPRRFAETDLHLIKAVADQLSVALQKANLYNNLHTALEQEQKIRSQLIQSERLALVGRLLASVSHELNNPLQAIQNALFLLKEDSTLSQQGHQDLDIVLSETDRMAALIERLRSAYRPIRTTDFQAVRLNPLIEDVYALMSTHMRHKEITFEFLPDIDLPPVSGNPDQLRQVILNLFLNAMEALQPGGHITVQTFYISAQNEALIVVHDSGSGIDPEFLPKIFEPFITSKNSGTGLGLTITHDIIEQHHGTIEAGNHPEGGAEFRVWLPIYTGDEK